MADVDINKFRASVVRDGSKPASPGFIVSEGQDPVNPPGTNNYVPYSGATANVELGEYGVEAGFITLDTTPTNTPTDQGTIFWDADDETVDIVLNGYTMKIGEDLFYPVKNQTGSTIAKGVAVRFNGTVGNSGRLLIAPFIADGSVPSSRFMGVTAEEILNGEDGKVLYFGRVRGINTNAFNEGDILYASTTVAGGYQTAIPVAPNNIVQVAAVVTKSATIGTIFVRPTLGSNINKDEGVKIVSVADKNLLQYQSGTSLWENKSLSQVLGGTSAQFVKGDGSLDSTTYGTGTVTSVGLSSATSGVTIGSSPVTTSGTITLAIATASGSQNGLLSSTDWSTFNSKQNALTNPVTGTGTSGQIAYFTGTSAISSESNLFWDATNDRLGIGNNTPATTLDVNGVGLFTGGSLVGNTKTGLYILDSNIISLANGTGPRNLFIQAENLSFYTGTTYGETMKLFSDGNLLIQNGGTFTNNGARLQVSGTATFSGNVGVKTLGRSESLSIEHTLGNNSALFVYTNGITAGQSYGLTVYAGTNSSDRSFLVANQGGGSPYLYVRGDGNVGIGTSSPATKLHITGTTEMRLDATSTGSIIQFWKDINASYASSIGNATPGGSLTNNLVFSTYIDGLSWSPRMTITSSGNVLIGTTTDSGSSQSLQIVKTGNSNYLRLQVDNSAGLDSALFFTDGTNNVYAGMMRGTSGLTGAYTIYTGGNNRFHVTSGGNVLIGTTTDVGRVSVDYSDTNNNGISINETSGVGSTFLMLFRSQNTNKGSIQINAGNTGVNFNTTSDYRLKEDLKNYNGFEIINKIKTYDYKWKNTNFRSYGVLAHELQEIIPDVISGKKDEIDDKGNEIMQGVDYSKLVPIMVKAIQELKQEIDNLKN